MPILNVPCPQCHQTYPAQVELDDVNRIDAIDNALYIPECLKCFVNTKIFAPDKAKEWLYQQLKVLPYAIIS